jgi:hypothetical protein
VFNLFVGFELPRPVVEIIKSIENDGLDVARAGNCSAGCDASTERARVDLGWTPLCRDEFRNGAGFGFSALRQGKTSRPRNRLGRVPSTCPWRVRTIVVMYEAALLGRVQADEISENFLQDDRRPSATAARRSCQQ